MEIRLRDIPADRRDVALRLAGRYEREHMHDGRGLGLRNCVVWSTPAGQIITYHTKTAIVVTTDHALVAS